MSEEFEVLKCQYCKGSGFTEMHPFYIAVNENGERITQQICGVCVGTGYDLKTTIEYFLEKIKEPK